MPDTTGQSRYSTRSSDPFVYYLTTQVEPSGIPEATCDRPSAKSQHKDSRPPEPQDKYHDDSSSVDEQKSYMSLSLFGLLRLNLLLALTYTRHKRGKLSSHLMLRDIIFDELFKNGNIKLSHTIPPIEIQSTINEGRLRFQEMKIDNTSVPISTLETMSKKLLVWSCVTDKGKVKILSLVILACLIYHA
jgi:hypothetical protein